jgi:hypothetical protein|nr:MAG TPA: hypothetical protein [Caudoviricetes sp.]
MFYKYKNKSMNQRILIAGDASAEAVTTLVFMALHDEFQFGKTRLERIVRIWDELPQSSMYEAQISRNGYNHSRMDREFAKKMMVVIAADKIGNKQLRDTIHAIMLGAVVVTLYILFRDYGFKVADIHRLEKRIYNYADILLDPDRYGVTIWRFMACIRYELNIRCEILKEFEKEYGRVDLGPKWGLNMKTGQPRKKNEVIP